MAASQETSGTTGTSGVRPAEEPIDLERGFQGRQDDFVALRNLQLHRLFGDEIRREVAEVTTRPEGVVVVIPTHNDRNKDRLGLIRTALQSLHDEIARGFDKPVRVLMSDNGVTDAQRQSIEEMLRSFGLEYTFVDARPHSRSEMNAAHARNIALREVQYLAQHDRSYYGDIVFLDDDAAFTPGALRILDGIHRQTERAVAVSAQIDSVVNLAESYRERARLAAPTVPFAMKRAVLLPRLDCEIGLDLGTIVAFGSQVATKTTCLLLDRVVLDRMVVKSGDAFLKYPNGSFEDMALGAALSQHGKVLVSPDAVALDQVPDRQDQLMFQKARWGRDHAIALGDFANIGQIESGIHVLRPTVHEGTPTWEQVTIPDPERKGVIVNPTKLRELEAILRRTIPDGIYDGLGPDFDISLLQSGVSTLKRVLELVEAKVDTPLVSSKMRDDLPPPTTKLPDHPRWSLDIAAHQLAGNLVGNQDINVFAGRGSREAIPRLMLYGVREYARWEEGPPASHLSPS